MSKHQLTGMRGVYLVAAELASRGLVVSTTSRSAVGADLLVTGESCARAYSVQVKTNARPTSFWLAGPKAREIVAATHVYVFVNLRPEGTPHEFYVVPSRHVAKVLVVSRRPASTWYEVRRDDIVQFRSRWRLLGGTQDVRAGAPDRKP